MPNNTDESDNTNNADKSHLQLIANQLEKLQREAEFLKLMSGELEDVAAAVAAMNGSVSESELAKILTQITNLEKSFASKISYRDSDIS